MSEYQYYEFQAVDRPLDQKSMDDLREISSRAEITPTSMVNVYNYGSFRGDPDELMERYFDAYLYLANWGSRHLSLRVPVNSFDAKEGKPYELDEVLAIRTTKTHIIFDFRLQPEEGDWDYVDGEGYLSPLLPLRYDLIGGDLRCLYLAWLIGVETGQALDDETEPPVPPGLKKLSKPLEEFAEFFQIDPDLIEVAARTSEHELSSGPSAKDLAAWVAELPEADKNKLLVRLMEGETAFGLGSELLNRHRKEEAQKKARPDRNSTAPRRTAAELLAAMKQLEEEKKQGAAKKAAAKAAKEALEKAAARSLHLDALMGREEELWRQVEEAVSKKLPKEYDRAMELLEDLRDLANRTNTTASMNARISQLRALHSSKRSFIDRLKKAGFP